MNRLHTALVTGAMVSGMALGAVALTAPVASAEVACNSAGECWHVRDRLTYPAGVGIVIHDDTWAARHHDNHWRWRNDRDDRGYYWHGAWRTF